MFRAGFFQKPLALCNGQINTCYLLLFLTVDCVFVATLILPTTKSKSRCLRKKKKMLNLPELKDMPNCALATGSPPAAADAGLLGWLCTKVHGGQQHAPSPCPRGNKCSRYTWLL